MPDNVGVEIRRLRDETAEDHAAAERSMPLLKDDLSLEEYCGVLERLFGVVAPWEGKLHDTRGMMGELAPVRSRVTMLESDLRRLGSDPGSLCWAILPRFDAREMAGAMYVMEGSRLGGLMLAHHLEQRFGAAGAESTAYFRGFGSGTRRRWSEFLEALEREVPEAESEQVVAGARRMFAFFSQWMGGGEQHSVRGPAGEETSTGYV